MRKLAVVTVTYNAERNLSFFLPSVERNGENVDGVFFIDNNSSDNTLKNLRAWKESNNSQSVEIISNTKNYGYAHAINIGIQQALAAGYEYLLITNNDVIFNEGMLAQLLDDIQSSYSDVIGVPASVNAMDIGVGYMLDKTILLPAKPARLLRQDVEEVSRKTPLLPIDFVHGGTILFSKRFFDAIGPYDDRLFFGGDELDFLYRVHAYNTTHEHKITCAVSLRAFLRMDNLTKHNTRNKITKAMRILQGTARVYLKHRFSPTDIGLYEEQYKIIKSLAKGSLMRYVLLYLFSLRALAVELSAYYYRTVSW